MHHRIKRETYINDLICQEVRGCFYRQQVVHPLAATIERNSAPNLWSEALGISRGYFCLCESAGGNEQGGGQSCLGWTNQISENDESLDRHSQ